MRGQLVPQERQRFQDARARVFIADEAAHEADADGGEAKSAGGDAGRQAGIVGSDVAAVLDQAGFGIGLLPEEEEVGVFEVVQKLVVFGREVTTERAEGPGTDAALRGGCGCDAGGCW